MHKHTHKHTRMHSAVTHARTALVDFVLEALPFVVHAVTCRCMRPRVSIGFVLSFEKRHFRCSPERSLNIGCAGQWETKGNFASAAKHSKKFTNSAHSLARKSTHAFTSNRTKKEYKHFPYFFFLVVSSPNIRGGGGWNVHRLNSSYDDVIPAVNNFFD